MESKIFAKLNFDPGILVILSLILTVVAIVLVIMLVLRQSRLEMNYKIFKMEKPLRIPSKHNLMILIL